MWRLLSLVVPIFAARITYDFVNNTCLCPQPNPGPYFIRNETRRSRFKPPLKEVFDIPRQCPQNIKNWKQVRRFLTQIEASTQDHCGIADNCRRVGKTDNHDKLTNASVFDFIVVGAGTAGSIVAGRLAAYSDKTVLLLEAGDVDPLYSRVPAFFNYFRFHNKTDWMYKTKYSEFYCKEKRGSCEIPRGKGLGGTSMYNDMIYLRGHPYDCENWFKSVGKSYTCSDFEPYYRKFENHIDMPIEDIEDSVYGTDGPMPVQKFKHRHKFIDRLIQATKDVGFKFIEDMFEKTTLSGGVGIAYTFTGHGQRFTPARTYLHPNKSNLIIVLKAHVNKVMLNENKTAYAVEYVLNDNWNETQYVEAREEIILSAGAINTPKILMLSGIGPKLELERVNIPLVKDLPVGQNLKAHYGFRMRYALGYYADHLNKKISMWRGSPYFLWENAMVYLNPNKTMKSVIFDDMLDHENWKLYLETGTGPLSSNGLTQLVGMFTSSTTKNKNKPDIQVVFSGFRADCSRIATQDLTRKLYHYPSHEGDKVYGGTAYRIMNGTPTSGSQLITIDVDAFAGRNIDAYIILLNPRSFGNITLSSNDPKDNPIIEANFLDDEDDVQMLIEGARIVDSIFLAKSMKDLKMEMPLKYFRPCAAVRWQQSRSQVYYQPPGYFYYIPKRNIDDAFLTCLAEHYTVGDYNQQGTAAIGKVVNENLLVKGVSGLRVVDGSIIPTTISGSPQATIMMFAERSIDMILEEVKSAHFDEN